MFVLHAICITIHWKSMIFSRVQYVFHIRVFIDSETHFTIRLYLAMSYLSSNVFNYSFSFSLENISSDYQERCAHGRIQLVVLMI